MDWSRLLPDGPGREYVSARCNGCHSVSLLMLEGRTRSDWEYVMRRAKVIWDLESYEVCACLSGPLPDDEIAIISSYLGEAFGPQGSFEQLPLNVNTASERSLLRLPGLTRNEVQKLLETRRRAPFRTKRQIEKILGPAKFRAIEDFVDVHDSNLRSDGMLPM